MRYLAEASAHGYVLFQQGEIAADKAQAFVEKMHDLHQVLASRGARDYARTKGRSRARLVMFPKSASDDAPPTFLFWLLSTEGKGSLAGQGNTQDARAPGSRLAWGTQYDLVSRPVRRRATGEKAYVWTWSMTDTTYGRWAERLRTAAGRVRSSQERKPDYLIDQVERLRRVPGFHAINRQKRSLILGADIPRQWHEQLQLRNLGTTVDKKLEMFAAGRTVRVLAQGPAQRSLIGPSSATTP